MTKILVCDDDPGVRDLLSLTLSFQHDVIAVCGGVEALAYLAEVEGRVDAVVLDVMMPDVDGFETLRRIRSAPGTADLPVLMLTARVAESDHVRGYQSGADAYIAKPFDAAALEAAIAEVLVLSLPERRRRREEEWSRAALLIQLEDRFG